MTVAARVLKTHSERADCNDYWLLQYAV